MVFMRYIISTILIISLLAPGIVNAGWTDDWMANATIDKPAHYKTTGGSYTSLGGFSARWQSTSDNNPISISLPKVKSGCGGIDIFEGGYHFVDTDWLVTKLQQILQNAPSVALDLALNVLCTQCAKVMKEMQNMTNALNNLQLDSCKASKAIVSYAMNETTSGHSEELNNNVQDFKNSTGVSDMYAQNAKSWSAVKDTLSSTDKTDVDATLAGCSADFKAIFVKTGESSILSNAAAKVSPAVTDSSYWQLMAGLFGDIGLSKDSTTGVYRIYKIEPCVENAAIVDTASFSSNLYLQDYSTGKCTSYNSDSYLKKTTDNLNSVVTALKSNSAVLTSSQIDFLNYSNPLTYKYLKIAVQNGIEAQVVEELAPVITRDMTNAMMTDLISKAVTLLNKVKEVKDKSSDADSSSSESQCAADTFSGAAQYVDALVINMNKYKEKLHNSVMVYNDGLMKQIAAAEMLNRANDQINNQIATKLGANVRMNMMAK